MGWTLIDHLLFRLVAPLFVIGLYMATQSDLVTLTVALMLLLVALARVIWDDNDPG